ncbi:kinase-like domain-containing protein [Pelagophyceae sp. CCMP2097]|nr:kinase-like domain-containing protein [Pelagophyceae sp. CCMP2097]
MPFPPWADGATTRTAAPAKQALRDFHILEELFRSAGGVVYKARRRKGAKDLVVLKERRCAELGRRRDIMNEVHLLEQLSHPNVIACFGSFWDDSRSGLFVVLEYAAGGDLYALLKRRKPHGLIPEAWIDSAAAQMSAGLQHLHERGVVHRDVKALNVLVGASTADAVFVEDGLGSLPLDPKLKIADLGVSRQVSEDTVFLKTMYGTPLYASPEVCEGRPYNEKTDIWSLGVVVYELAALRPPFLAQSLLALAQTIKKGVYAPISSTYSDRLASAIASMLQQDMAKRPSISQVLALFGGRVSSAGRGGAVRGDAAQAPPPPAAPAPAADDAAAGTSAPRGRARERAPRAAADSRRPADARPETTEDGREDSLGPKARQRLEAQLRRTRLHLANLRAAAKLRDDDDGATVYRIERELLAIVQALDDAVPRRRASSPAAGSAGARENAKPEPGASPTKPHPTKPHPTTDKLSAPLAPPPPFAQAPPPFEPPSPLKPAARAAPWDADSAGGRRAAKPAFEIYRRDSSPGKQALFGVDRRPVLRAPEEVRHNRDKIFSAQHMAPPRASLGDAPTRTTRSRPQHESPAAGVRHEDDARHVSPLTIRAVSSNRHVAAATGERVGGDRGAAGGRFARTVGGPRAPPRRRSERTRTPTER